ncbi:MULTISPECIES: FHA domain-containing protein [Crateriforma]|uniref:FHA domain-containing protein FhaA n=1 Tax=Crateriforma conspicua TaxID=2527996 RepID=A0A5C6FWI5_9PLAN|nr:MULTISPECIES: FHA domain-containing protein [Crateriforma]TWU65678.1 FHA domain-containing protein FhaA [Crateriforma conspicua]
MSGVTIKILHGADRGRVYEEVQLPMTIGREEGNDIQLNDERVSRCHLKIQRDNDRLVLTDLDSTNGTKVNGVECQLKILRHGDLIAVGRSLMLVGSEEQIAARLAAMGTDGPTVKREMGSSDSSMRVELQGTNSPIPAEMMQVRELPNVPKDLSPGQKAQICEVLDYLQERLHRLIESAKHDDSGQDVNLQLGAWHRLLDTQAELAEMVRQITDPDWPS